MSSWSDALQNAEQEIWEEIAANESVITESAADRLNALREEEDNTVACDGCNGSGIYYGAGSVVNGQFVGFTGTCYRCGGKGRQTPSDVKRNWGYDRNRRFAP